MRLLPYVVCAACFLAAAGSVDLARAEDVPVVREIASKDLPALAAAFEANLVTGQLAGGRRVVVVRKKEDTRFPAIEWLGLRDRDTVERVNGTAPRSAGAVVDTIRGLGGGDELTLRVLRDGVSRAHILRVGVTPAALPKPADKQHDDVMVLREDVLEAEWADVEPWTLLVAAAPVMARDASGKVIGVTSSTFSEIPFAAMLGLRSGDIIQSVNGYPVESEQAIFTLINKLEGERFFTAVVLRKGKPLTLRYRVE
jgi:type II secretory pathway component PulC